MTPLRHRMTEEMQIRDLAKNTQQAYLLQVSAFARFFRKSPEELGPEQIRTYQLHLIKVKKLAPSSLCIGHSAAMIKAIRYFIAEDSDTLAP